MKHSSYDCVLKLREKETKNIVGLISGTSADGVTAVIAEIGSCHTDIKIDLKKFKTYEFPPTLREDIFHLFSQQTSTSENICKINFVLGEYFAEVVNRIIDETGFSLEDIDLIGSHGQTIWHNPKQENLHGYLASSTLQIGEPTIITKRLGIPVVADFRKADMSVGGEGAPLTPYLDYILHKQYDKSIILQNIGGIANLTYLPKNCGINDVIAFDTGPGNMMIDAAVKFYYGGTASFDKDGSHAFKGEVNHDLLIEFLGNPYFSRNPPKSTGREDFGEEYTRNIIVNNPRIDKDDLIATFSDFTAESIVKSYRDFLPEPVNSVYVSGGGSKNLYIMKRLQEKMNPIPVKSYDDLGYNSEAKEALLFAVLANEHIMGIPANIPSITGAREPVVLGTLYV